MNRNKVKNLLLLHGLFLLYSLCGVLSKYAAKSPLFSFNFILCYGLEILILFIYAIGWQQILKRLPLTTAFSNKGITVLWSLIWGIFIFGETISSKKIAGATLVITGIIIYSGGEQTE